MKDKRERMVAEIQHSYGLDSPEVFSVMRKVPREKFIPKASEDFAYMDRPVSIGYGQTMSQPYTVAFMTHLLLSDRRGKVGKGIEKWKVLEIGTGSGYQAAVLSKLVNEVYTMEIITQLAKSAARAFKKLKYSNIDLKAGSGEWGWIEKAPFDAIMITAQLEKIPDAIFDQLKTGGRIIAPIGNRKLQVLTRFTKEKDGTIKEEKFQKYVFVPFVQQKN